MTDAQIEAQLERELEKQAQTLNTAFEAIADPAVRAQIVGALRSQALLVPTKSDYTDLKYIETGVQRARLHRKMRDGLQQLGDIFAKVLSGDRNSVLEELPREVAIFHR